MLKLNYSSTPDVPDDFDHPPWPPLAVRAGSMLDEATDYVMSIGHYLNTAVAQQIEGELLDIVQCIVFQVEYVLSPHMVYVPKLHPDYSIIKHVRMEQSHAQRFYYLMCLEVFNGATLLLQKPSYVEAQLRIGIGRTAYYDLQDIQ